MRRLRRIAIGLAGGVAVWLGILVVFGWLGADCQRRRTEDRLAAKMRAKVSIGDLSIDLITGEINLAHLRIERDDRGLFRLEVDRVDVDRWPFGLALIQGGAGDVRIRGARVEVTALGALDLRGGHGKPLHFDSLSIRDATVAIEATRILPGFTRITVHLDRADAGDTTLRTPMSWLFALRTLDATATLPGGTTVRLQYAPGVLHLSGTLVGDQPIDLPFDVPVHDPAHELDQLRDMGLSLARALLSEAAKRFLESP